MLKNPLQTTCDKQIFFLILKKLVKSQIRHTEKPFAGHMWSAKGLVSKGFFSMTTLWFDKFFDLQSFLMMVVLLLLLYENRLIDVVVSNIVDSPI